MGFANAFNQAVGAGLVFRSWRASGAMRQYISHRWAVGVSLLRCWPNPSFKRTRCAGRLNPTLGPHPTEHQMPRDLLLFLIAVAVSFFLAMGTVIRSSPEKIVWPMRLYQLMLLTNPWPQIRRYAESRKTFALREQFLVSWLVWFFIVFIGLIFFYGCRRHEC